MPGTRFTDKYLHARMASSRSSYYSSPYLPARPAPEKTSPTKVVPASPPRKVVTDFKAFGAPSTASVFGTAVQSTPFSLAGGKAAFGGIRNNGRSAAFDDDDDDDDDNGRQRVELREDSITLDQVRRVIPSGCARLLTMCHVVLQARRIAMQSAWRSTRM